MEKKFIERYALYADKYSSIQNDLKINRDTFYQMIQDLAVEINIARKVRQLCIRKGIEERNYKSFYNWYISTPRVCHYCGINEVDLEFYFENLDTINKRPTRGKTLEIDRLNPLISDYNIIDNLVFSCYICNNAKSDFFSEEQFRSIGLEIGKTLSSIIKRKRNG